MEPVIEVPKAEKIKERIFVRKLSDVPKAPISTKDTITMVTLPSIIALSEFLDTLCGNNVTVNTTADRKDNTCNTGDGEGEA